MYAIRSYYEIEDESGWEVIVGTRDSSEVPAFLAKIW